jgi:hypothetical protein
VDSTPGLTEAALRIRDSIDCFAQSKNWARADYRIVMDANLVWYYFHVDIFAKEYDSSVTDDKARYDEVYDRLEKDLSDEPSLYEAIGVLLWPFSCHDAKLPLGENDVRIYDSLLNPGWVEPQPSHQVSTG